MHSDAHSLDRRRDGDRVRLHQRLPRHRERDRDLGLDARACRRGSPWSWPPSLNFVGAFLSLAVAATIAKGIVDSTSITLLTVFAGLIGAIAWNLVTWWFGLPSSSSHALIGGMVGATLVSEGPSAVLWDGLIEKVAVPALVAPVLAMARRRAGDPRRLPDRRAPVAGRRDARLPARPAGLQRAVLAVARHQRRAEDDGDHLPRAGREREPERGRRHPDVGDRLLGDRDRARHLLRRLADRAHDGLEDHQDGPGAGLRGPGRGRGGDPVGLARRLPAVDHARDVAARSWARARPSGSPRCAGASPATSSSPGS